MTTTKEHIGDLHRKAMKLAQRAILASDAGKLQDAVALYDRAFVMEKQVAMFFLDSGHEPSRSVYFRSAAALAMNCNRFQEAKDLINIGLSKNTPLPIAEEMMDIHEKITQKELAQMYEQKQKELSSFMQDKTEELTKTVKRMRAIFKQQIAQNEA